MSEVTAKKLTKKDLIRTWLAWICWAQRCYNYERLQGLGFCHAISVVIKRLYTDKEEISAALTRNMAFYNTENTWGSIIIGVTAALEEEIAQNKEINPDVVNNVKTALMGPMAGIGDSVTQGIVKVILLGIGIDLAMQGNAIGPILFILLFTVYTAGLSYFLFFSGYKMGKNAVIKLLSSSVAKYFTNSLKIMSMMVVGGLAASNIKATTPVVIKLGETTTQLQSILDKILPQMLPLIVLSFVFYLLRKKKSTTYILIVLFIIGFITSFLKVLA